MDHRVDIGSVLGELGDLVDFQVVWNTSNPDLPVCFQKTVLTWVPCGFLWIFAPLLIATFSTSPRRLIPWSGLIVAKLVISIFITLTIAADMIRSVNLYLNEYEIASVDFYSPLIQFISFIFVTALMSVEKRCGTPPSGVIFTFWFLTSLAGVVTYRTKILSSVDENVPLDQFSFVTYMIYYPLVVAETILCCFSDARPLATLASNEKKLCPEVNSSFLSRMYFAWFDSMGIAGYRRTLQYDDVWGLSEEFKCQKISSQFQSHWSHQLTKNMSAQLDKSNSANERVKFEGTRNYAHKPSFFKALCKCFGGEFLYTVILELFNTAFIFVSPLILELLIKLVQNDEPLWRGYLYGAIIFATSLCQSLVNTRSFYVSYCIGVKVRSAMISAIYRKSLRLSNSALRSSTVGEIVNLMAVDVQYFLSLIGDLNAVWTAPLQIAVALYMLWGQLGPSVLAGVAVLILLLPANGVLMKKIEKFQRQQMVNKDHRIKLMNELLNGIKVLKMYAWEAPFAEQINKVRSKELSLLKTSAYYNGVSDFIWRASPFFTLLATFGTYVLIDDANQLDATKAFVSLSLFNILQAPMTVIPGVLVGIAQARVSLVRMQKFLLNEELDPHSTLRDTSKDDSYPIIIQDGTFSWDIKDEAVLKDIMLTIPRGQLVAIVGSVGAGKSSLLSAILGEMEKINGMVKTQASIAYTSQQAWIQNATVRDNILLGNPYDPEMYQRTIEACDLQRDLDILPAGSDTEIGEKGLNLSGGQKQRISLARAVYSDTSLYLLDDPLSAVDSHVGKHVFENVIGPNGLLKNKTRLLVTHSVTYLSQVDLIVVLKDKSISEKGSYQDLLARKGAFAEFLISYLSEIKTDDNDEALHEIELELRMKLGMDVSELVSCNDSDVTANERKMSQGIDLPSPKRKESDAKETRKSDAKKGKLVTTEVAAAGQVSFRTYLFYLHSIGFWLGIATLFLNMLAWTASIGTNLWLEVWSSDPPPVNGTTQDTSLRDLRLGVYAGLSFLFAFLIFAGTMTLVLNCARGSYVLHDQILKTILHSPMSFFDTTPIGRILNRFAQDLNAIDTMLPARARASLSTSLQMIGALLVIAVETPIFIAALIPIGVLYYAIQKFYISTSRQLKRMESITRSPIYTHFSETLSGASTIRAYHKQLDFIKESDRRVDEGQCYYFANVVCNRWLQIRLDFVGSLIVVFAILFAILNKDNMTSSSVALSITYALSVTSLLNWCVRRISDLEKEFVAVERIKEYVGTGHEAPWEVKDNKPSSNWPDMGCITFDKYETRYREGLDLVLRGISCDIASGEKIGIVGRTGSGKSSLTLALLRIIEASSGTIMIDGIDISKIGLRDLRSKLTIIPQDPVLFCGSLRHNLDPFNCYSDEQLWTALKHCHLFDFVRTLPEALCYEIAEGGENLSLGQRQLVCLGRALLRKTKVFILDEATAAIDLETDELIQETIRKEFAECTILTVAHRLNTIMDSDRVIVLDEGIIKEFDTPSSLLQDTDSVFYKMAKDAGLV